MSVHAPLNRDTYHLIGAAELARMGDDAILVNTGRGGVVDEVALAEALRRGAAVGGRARRAGGGAADRRPPAAGACPT